MTLDLLPAVPAASSTAAALTAAALDGTPYDLVVSTGIGGGFQPEAPVGIPRRRRRDHRGGPGAEQTADGFLPVTELGFGTVSHRPPPSLVREVVSATGGRAGTVLTVSTMTGSAERAAELRARHPRALAEAMEGFGVAEATVPAHVRPSWRCARSPTPSARATAPPGASERLSRPSPRCSGKLAPVLEMDPHDPDHQP